MTLRDYCCSIRPAAVPLTVLEITGLVFVMTFVAHIESCPVMLFQRMTDVRPFEPSPMLVETIAQLQWDLTIDIQPV